MARFVLWQGLAVSMWFGAVALAEPAPEAPRDAGAVPVWAPSETWTIDQASRGLTTIEKHIDPQQFGFVRVQSYDYGTGRVELCGSVGSADELARLVDALKQIEGVTDVGVRDVVLAGESPRQLDEALRHAIAHLQDGRGYDHVIHDARTLIASTDPSLRATGVLFTAVACFEMHDPARGAGWLRLLPAIDPALLDPAQLMKFMSGPNFFPLTRIPAETWNTDIVNPFFAPSSKLGSGLRNLPSAETLSLLVLAPPADERGDSYVSLNEESAGADDVAVPGGVAPAKTPPVPVFGCGWHPWGGTCAGARWWPGWYGVGYGCGGGFGCGGYGCGVWNGWQWGYAAPCSYAAFDWLIVPRYAYGWYPTWYGWPGYGYTGWAPTLWYVPQPWPSHSHWPWKHGLFL